jgi:hypothetical protein
MAKVAYVYTGTQWVELATALSTVATGGGSDQVFYENEQIVSQDYTITTGKNAGTLGPETINTGVTVSVPSGSVWTIV